MRRALLNGEMCLFYQPKLNMRTDRIDGVEALVRWIHPRRGMIAPDLFVPMAEETGHVRALTDWVLARALEEQAALSRAGFPLTMSVNISGRLMGERDFAQAAAAAVANRTPRLLLRDHGNGGHRQSRGRAREHRSVRAAWREDRDRRLRLRSVVACVSETAARTRTEDRQDVRPGLTSTQREALLVRSTIELAHGLECALQLRAWKIRQRSACLRQWVATWRRAFSSDARCRLTNS